MLLNRNLFLLLLFAVIIGPFVAYKLVWIARSQQTTGVMCFEGHTLELQGISSHPVILFRVGRDSIFFNGNFDLNLKPGAIVPVIYQKNDPSDAKINKPLCIWLDTIGYCLFSFSVLLVIFLTPDRFDPLVLWRSRVLIGKGAFIKIIKF
ncbi:MAG TPA: hypothetical protein VE035_18795 [Puia sp.]|nr:hypothetical protein [Puia sp.]